MTIPLLLYYYNNYIIYFLQFQGHWLLYKGSRCPWQRSRNNMTPGWVNGGDTTSNIGTNSVWHTNNSQLITSTGFGWTSCCRWEGKGTAGVGGEVGGRQQNTKREHIAVGQTIHLVTAYRLPCNSGLRNLVQTFDDGPNYDSPRQTIMSQRLAPLLSNGSL